MCVISKSGTTLEPSIAFEMLRGYLRQRYGAAEAAKRIYAVTDASKGALRDEADAQGYKAFVVPDDIGGRYSVLTVERIRKDVSLEDSQFAGAAKTLHQLNLIVEDSARKAHRKNNTPNIRLTVGELSARSFGYMVYFFEKACAVSCYLTGVNPFNQPGVEAYKSNIKAALKMMN